MARARLHLICGNCGCNDMFSYRVEECEDEGQLIYLTCGNCATLHNLNDNAKRKEEELTNNQSNQQSEE